MLKKVMSFLLIVSICLTLTACGCSHEWKEADCEYPKTCLKCGKTDGSALGHLDGGWEKQKPDYVLAQVKSVKRCTRCGEIIEEKTEKLTSLHDASLFLMSPNEFMERIQMLFSEYSAPRTRVKSGSSDGALVCRVTIDGANLGDILFIKDGEQITKDRADERTFQGVLAFADNEEVAARITLGIIRCLDPEISVDEAGDLGEQAVKNMTAEYNGITYVCGIQEDDTFLIGAAIDQN